MALTEAEIMGEPAGRRLDMWIARYVLGLTVRVKEVNSPERGAIVAWDFYDQSPRETPEHGSTPRWKPVRSYSTDISNAWAIWHSYLTDTKTRGYIDYSPAENRWRVTLADHHLDSSLARDVPALICRSMLLTVMNLWPPLPDLN